MASKFFPYGVREPAKRPKTADKVLNEYLELMGSIGVRSYLAFGTCLGFVRDGGYIPGDNDIDVVAFTRTGGIIPDIVETLVKAGFTRGQSFPPPKNNIHFHKKRILIDVHCRRPSKLYAKLGTVEYKGKMYPVPRPVSAYLKRHYGEWRVKLK